VTAAGRQPDAESARSVDLLGLLTAEARATLAGLFEDGDNARRLLLRLGELAGLPRRSTPFLEALLGQLETTPNPDRALVNLVVWAERLGGAGDLFTLWEERPAFTAGLLRLLSLSQHLAEALIRDPDAYGFLAEARAPLTLEALCAEVTRICRGPRHADRADELRRLRRREYLRLGWLDLTGRAEFQAIVRGISDLAEACVRGVLQLARNQVAPTFPSAAPGVRFSVIAFGKLGGRELNYSSDIDLMFLYDTEDEVTEGQRRFATRVAQEAVDLLGAATGEGFLYRVDLRLRPEGSLGAVARSWDSLQAYFDRYIETWERQALIKARPIAGDADLGRRFEARAQRVSYLRYQPVELFAEVREMKAALEGRVALAGEMNRNVKEGRGAIRDVEFTLQLLQLLFGAETPGLRSRNTLDGLRRLREHDLLTDAEHRALAEGYVFFRRLEHLLQLAADLPVRVLPEAPRERAVLARGMGFETLPEFEEALAAHADGVRTLTLDLLRRLGLGEVETEDPLERLVLTLETADAEAALQERLAALGFPDPAAATAEVRALAIGGDRYRQSGSSRREFARLASPLLNAAAAAPDPNAALRAIRDLAERNLLHRGFYQTLREQPETLRRLCAVGGASRLLTEIWLRRPELLDRALIPAAEQSRLAPADFREELERRLIGARTGRQRRRALARFREREFVRLGTAELLALDEPLAIAGEYSDLVQALVAAALDLAAENLALAGRSPPDLDGFLVLGLGRLGGREMHFRSDLDLAYLCDAERGNPRDYQRLAAEFDRLLGDPVPDGRLFELDLRLRPEGRQGALVLSLEGAERYYRERGQPWEFLALQRARPVAGNPALAEQFRERVTPLIYRPEMPAAWWRQLRHLKRRVERERVSPAERDRNLKLGPGGLSDIEFLVQALQLQHGYAHPEARSPNTATGIQRLTAAGCLTAPEAETLIETLSFLTRVRQRAGLLREDLSADLVPAPGPMLIALSRGLGYDSEAQFEAARRERQQAVRSLFERRFRGEDAEVKGG